MERAAAPRVPDGRDPHLRRPARPRPRRRASPRSATRSPRACARAYDEGEPLPDLPHRLLEENLWRAIRYGLSGELIDFERGEPVPARARIEQLLEWVAPVADEIGAAPFLAIPAANAAERQIERVAEGATLREIYAEQVQAGERIGWLTSVDPTRPLEPSSSSRRFDVDRVPASRPASTAARSLALSPSSSGGDLGPRPGKAIDAMAAPRCRTLEGGELESATSEQAL